VPIKRKMKKKEMERTTRGKSFFLGDFCFREFKR